MSSSSIPRLMTPMQQAYVANARARLAATNRPELEAQSPGRTALLNSSETRLREAPPTQARATRHRHRPNRVERWLPTGLFVGLVLAIVGLVLALLPLVASQ